MKILLLLFLALQDPEAEFRELVQHVLMHTEEFKIVISGGARRSPRESLSEVGSLQQPIP